MKIKLNNLEYELTDVMIRESVLIEKLINNEFKKEDYKLEILDKKGNMIKDEHIGCIINYINNKSTKYFNMSNLLECYHIAKILIIDSIIKELYNLICILMLPKKIIYSIHHDLFRYSYNDFMITRFENQNGFILELANCMYKYENNRFYKFKDSIALYEYDKNNVRIDYYYEDIVYVAFKQKINFIKNYHLYFEMKNFCIDIDNLNIENTDYYKNNFDKLIILIKQVEEINDNLAKCFMTFGFVEKLINKTNVFHGLGLVSFEDLKHLSIFKIDEKSREKEIFFESNKIDLYDFIEDIPNIIKEKFDNWQ